MTGAGARDSHPAIVWRSKLVPEDGRIIRALAEATRVFTADELAIAEELVHEACSKGDSAGYQFLIAECDGAIAAFACFGPIPGTEGSFDLYWIAVRPGHQGSGLARETLSRVEAAAAALGARRIFIDTSGSAAYARARAFYQAAGYARVASLPDFYRPGDAKVIFAKSLP